YLNSVSLRYSIILQMSSVIVYGGKGALGHSIVVHFKANGFRVISIDVFANEEADENVIVDVNGSWMEQEKGILEGLSSKGVKEVDGVFCVAGGWAGGNASSSDLISNADLMWKQSVLSSTIAARIGVKHLKKGGILTLTGADAARHGTAGMIGYGMAKAAVHQLTKSLAEKDSGLPEGVTVVAILPVTLDTPMNRKWMPDADHSSWTPLSFIAGKIDSWVKKSDSRPPNGTLLSLKTTGGVTNEEMH
ncbi:hypothetical protein PMAYCL1PPCAC_07097, partial [Pristionchus mayeri]